MTTSFLVTDKLTKHYRDFAALSDCSLSVQTGEIYGLLGPNGAGKTTLLRLIMGFLRPTRGSARISNLDCYAESVRVHELVSYLPGDPRLFPSWRGEQVIQFFAQIHPRGDVARSRNLAKRLDLDLTRKVAYCSTGMRQKLAFAVTMANDTPMVILDEPTANLDPTVRLEVLSLIRAAKEAGRTVLFSSHVFSEAEQTCDRVAILKNGQLVHTQPMNELRKQHKVTATLTASMPAIPNGLMPQISNLSSEEKTLQLLVAGELPKALGWLATLPIHDVRIEPVGLSVVYERFHGRSHS